MEEIKTWFSLLGILVVALIALSAVRDAASALDSDSQVILTTIKNLEEVIEITTFLIAATPPAFLTDLIRRLLKLSTQPPI